MNRYLLYLIAAATVSFNNNSAFAQELVPNQNPNYSVSLSKYMQVADSLNRWHGTTQHEMYKAIDWLADRKEARADRREFRRQLRLERAGWADNYYYSGYYHNNFNHQYRHNYYRRNRSFGVSPWYGLNFWWR